MSDHANDSKHFSRNIRLLPLCFFVSLLLSLSASLHAQQTEKVYLSGTGSDHTVNWDFFCTGGMNANKWTKIAVPSCWELQGFGKYDYGFAKDSVRGKEQGLYKYNFQAPASWKGKTVNIVFEGVMTDAAVKLNGKPAGPAHQGAFYAFKYDVTKLLKYGGDNILELTVSKHSANESVNNAERKADFWIFGGIFRPVWLEVLPATHFENIAIDAKADGSFFASINTNNGKEHFDVSVDLLNEKSELIKTITAANMNDNAWNTFVAQYHFEHPNLWTPESPTIYSAVFKIIYQGKVLHTVTKKFGFRTVEVKQRDGIYVNGVKVKMKAVNRHSFRPETGRTMNKQNSIEDILLMREMNMNAVRMSHYPPDDHFLDACDSLGLFVMDELAGWHGHYDNPTGTKLLKEMIVHDVNHPSIIFWSNGNEGGHNFDLDSLFTRFDIQQRPVIHPWQLFGGIETQHYREYNYGIGNYEYGKEIVMPTEFLHGQFDGGHGAGLEDYWEKMWHDPLSAGGFLWDFADNAVVRKDMNDSLDTDKHRAADGILGPHHEKEGSYYAIKEIWSPIYFERREITDAFDGKLNIENRYHFTNVNQCRFSWKLKKLLVDSEKTGQSISPDIEPMAKGSLLIKLPSDWKDYDVLYVTAKDKFQREIYTWSWSLNKPKLPKMHFGNSPLIIDRMATDTTYTIAQNKLQVSFSKKTGMLTEVKNNGAIIPFTNGPILCEGEAIPDSVIIKNGNDEIRIECKYGKKSLIHSLIWNLDRSGILRMSIQYFPAAYFTNFAGVNFSFPENEIKSVQYVGNGPYRVWKNRLKGTQFGLWNKTYNNTETGESPWIYPEFKGYYSNVYWCRFNMKDNRSFKVYTSNENMFLRLFTPVWKTDQWHNYEPLFPAGDISFMQGISSIGTKTQRNETTGPMGFKNIFYDYEKDPARTLKLELYFDFSENE